jgi:hypothetical protein
LLFVFFSVMLTGNAVPFFLFLLSLVLRAISLNRPSGNIYIYKQNVREKKRQS